MRIKIFEARSGQRPVDDFIYQQDLSTRKKIAFRLNLLERFGLQLGMPYSKKITNNLYELRIRSTVEVRIIYGAKNDFIVLLHGFKKKQNKIPAKELETAIGRLKQLE